MVVTTGLFNGIIKQVETEFEATIHAIEYGNFLIRLKSHGEDFVAKFTQEQRAYMWSKSLKVGSKIRVSIFFNGELYELKSIESISD